MSPEFNFGKLNDELEKYKIENEQLKIKINTLLYENNKLTNELNQAKIIISNNNTKNKNNQQDNESMVKSLNDIIESQEKEINKLKLELQKNNINSTQNPINLDETMTINFYSLDQKINCKINCLKTDTFAEVEEKLYQRYEEYRETNNNFIINGKLILRFKKIYENNINNEDKVQLLYRVNN